MFVCIYVHVCTRLCKPQHSLAEHNTHSTKSLSRSISLETAPAMQDSSINVMVNCCKRTGIHCLVSVRYNN